MQDQINAAVEEVFINIANYAYEPERGYAIISIASYGEEEEILVRFEDSGKPYNPLEEKKPDFDIPLMEREQGGLGIFLVKKLMDKVYYSHIDNKNILIIAKRN